MGLNCLKAAEQGLKNCEHGDKRARNVHAEVITCTKLRARKSMKTPLGSVI